MVSAERICVFSLTQLMLWFLLVLLPLTTANSATTSEPDTTPPTTASSSEACTPLERRCWSRGLVPSPDGAGCSELLARGPCAEGEWVLLDGDALDAPTGPRLRALCAPRPCPEQRQVLRKGRCQSWDEAGAALCGGDTLHVGPTGIPRCGPFRGWEDYFFAFETCSEPETLATTLPVPAHNCIESDSAGCVMDVEGSTSAAVVKSEDAQNVATESATMLVEL